MKKKDVFKRILMCFIAVIAMVITVGMCVFMYQLKNTDNLSAFETHIKEIGNLGIVVMMIIQIMQIIFPIIPGEPVELAMGAMYGAFWGSLMCIMGIAAGGAAVFLSVRRFGKRFVDAFAENEKIRKLSFLHSDEKRDLLLFLLMFIPGTPKDVLTYFAPFTKISFFRFMVISVIARIPSVVSSAYIGANLMEQNFLVAAIGFAAVGTVSICGIVFYNRTVGAGNSRVRKEKT